MGDRRIHQIAMQTPKACDPRPFRKAALADNLAVRSGAIFPFRPGRTLTLEAE
jgi:hypothetical protein